MIPLSSVQQEIHRRALEISRGYLRAEFGLVDVPNEVERSKLHKRLNCSSVFKYATDMLGLSESISYALISVARKTREIPELRTSGLSISKASRIVSVLNWQNANELIDFARTHSKREVEKEVARINPQAALPERVRVVSEEFYEMRLSVPAQLMRKLERIRELEAQRTSGSSDFVKAIAASADEYLFHRDPVKKAERARERRNKAGELCPGRVSEKVMAKQENAKPETTRTKISSIRRPLTASQRHAVFARDGGQCTFKDANEKICGGQRWIDIHHVKPVSEGGTNDPENLTTLCSFHHDHLHGSVLCSPVVQYAEA